MGKRSSYTEAEVLASQYMLTVPPHLEGAEGARGAAPGPAAAPQTVYIAARSTRGAAGMVWSGREARVASSFERVEYVDEDEFYDRVRILLDFAYRSKITRQLHSFRRHGGACGASPFSRPSSGPGGAGALGTGVCAACPACADFAWNVVFGLVSRDEATGAVVTTPGVIAKLNRRGRAPLPLVTNLAGYYRRTVERETTSMYRHLAGRAGDPTRMDAKRVPGDLPAEAKEVVALLVNKLTDRRCTAVPLEALADHYAMRHKCDSPTAAVRVRQILTEAQATLSTVRTGGTDWWTRRVAGPLERNAAGPGSLHAPFDFKVDSPRTVGDVLGGELSTTPGQGNDHLPVDGAGFEDVGESFLSQLGRAKDRIIEAFSPADCAADPESERARVLTLAQAEIDFVVSLNAPAELSRRPLTRAEARNLAAEWAGDLVASVGARGAGGREAGARSAQGAGAHQRA